MRVSGFGYGPLAGNYKHIDGPSDFVKVAVDVSKMACVLDTVKVACSYSRRFNSYFKISLTTI
jgi:hypothetical protein